VCFGPSNRIIKSIIIGCNTICDRPSYNNSNLWANQTRLFRRNSDLENLKNEYSNFCWWATQEFQYNLYYPRNSSMHISWNVIWIWKISKMNIRIFVDEQLKNFNIIYITQEILACTLFFSICPFWFFSDEFFSNVPS
jgi:hypothetical protein